MSDTPASRPSAPPSDPRETRCPSCGSTKVAPTEGNAVGNVMDCLDCYTDFTPRSGDGDPTPPLTAEKRAEIQELATGEHAGREWGGVLADRYFIAYEATVRALESALASQRAARARCWAALNSIATTAADPSHYGEEPQAVIARLQEIARVALAGQPEAVSRG